jgi:hypothetical protein
MDFGPMLCHIFFLGTFCLDFLDAKKILSINLM